MHQMYGLCVRHLNFRVADVSMMRLSDFVTNVVATRKVPPMNQAKLKSQPPAVLMKMDIEGSEIEAMTDLVLTGATRQEQKIFPTQSFYVF